MEEWEQSIVLAALERVAAMLDAVELDVAPVLETGDLRKQD